MIPTEERQNHTPEQVRAHLEGALALVDELRPSSDLRVAVFEKACDLLSGKQIYAMPGQPVDLSAIIGNGRL